MGWPKGQPRKGYVKKDGTKPLGWGQRKVGIKSDPPVQTVKVIEKPKPVMRVVKETSDVEYKSTGRPIIEPCPNCQYPYADGGYCEKCGWTQFRPDCPHCVATKKGRK